MRIFKESSRSKVFGGAWRMRGPLGYIRFLRSVLQQRRLRRFTWEPTQPLIGPEPDRTSLEVFELVKPRKRGAMTSALSSVGRRLYRMPGTVSASKNPGRHSNSLLVWKGQGSKTSCSGPGLPENEPPSLGRRFLAVLILVLALPGAVWLFFPAVSLFLWVVDLWDLKVQQPLSHLLWSLGL